MKVVLAHDSFTQLGGAERVVLEMAQMFPDAPIFVLAYDRKVFAQLPESVQKRVHTSPLQWLYRMYPRFQHLLPFIPLAVWLTRIPVCDVLLSSSSAFAKGFRKPNGAKHINYCHTPTRFLWSDSEYVVQEVPWLLRLPARLFLWWMKWWDVRAASGVDVFLANSKETQTRIKKYYDRDSEAVYPFVDMAFWKFDSAKSPSDSSPREERQGEVVANGESTLAVSTTPSGSPSGGGGQKSYFLIAGRLHAHKHNDLVVEVCNELGLQLHVVGTGRDEEHLKAIAGPTITFLGRVSDEDLREEYRHADGYIYPQLEDFGLMPVEAAACGTPTIGIAEGGSAETIIPGVTGEWFARGNKEDLKKILRSWSKARYSVEALTAHAQCFSKEQFRKHLSESIEQSLTNRSE